MTAAKSFQSLEFATSVLSAKTSTSAAAAKKASLTSISLSRLSFQIRLMSLG